MRLILFLSLISLAGCGSPEADLNDALSGYAQSAESGYGFDQYLIGEALDSAIQTQELLDELGLVSMGQAEFKELELVGESSARACMDLGAITVVDSLGLLADLPPRANELAVLIQFQDIDHQLFISGLEVRDAKC
jgi:hypothetical protein